MDVKTRRATLEDQERIRDFLEAAYEDRAEYKYPKRWLWAFVDNHTHFASVRRRTRFLQRSAYIGGMEAAPHTFGGTGSKSLPVVFSYVHHPDIPSTIRAFVQAEKIIRPHERAYLWKGGGVRPYLACCLNNDTEHVGRGETLSLLWVSPLPVDAGFCIYEDKRSWPMATRTSPRPPIRKKPGGVGLWR